MPTCRAVGLVLVGAALVAACAARVNVGAGNSCTHLSLNHTEAISFNWTNVYNMSDPWTAKGEDEFGTHWQIWFNYCGGLPRAIDPYGDVCPKGANGCVVDLTNKKAHSVGNTITWGFSPRTGTDTIVDEILDGGISTEASMECAVGLQHPSIKYTIGGDEDQVSLCRGKERGKASKGRRNCCTHSLPSPGEQQFLVKHECFCANTTSAVCRPPIW